MKTSTFTSIFAKITVLTLVFAGVMHESSAYACTPVAGTIAPTSQSVIREGGNVVIGSIVATGDIVVGKVLEKKQGTSYDYVVMVSDKTSCGTHPDAFNVGEFFVAITTQGNSFIIQHVDLDSQFTLFYRPLFEAQQGAEQIMKSITDVPVVTSGGGDTPVVTGAYVPVGHSLKPGMKNDEVRALQEALKKVTGITLEKVDGSYGDKTKAAVTQFQTMKNLTTDGLAGVKTQNALRDHLASLAPAPTTNPTAPVI